MTQRLCCFSHEVLQLRTHNKSQSCILSVSHPCKSAFFMCFSWSELQCGFVFRSWRFKWFNCQHHLLGISTVVHTSLSQRKLDPHSGIRQNLQNKCHQWKTINIQTKPTAQSGLIWCWWKIFPWFRNYSSLPKLHNNSLLSTKIDWVSLVKYQMFVWEEDKHCLVKHLA